jgi:hypothetical protein
MEQILKLVGALIVAAFIVDKSKKLSDAKKPTLKQGRGIMPLDLEAQKVKAISDLAKAEAASEIIDDATYEQRQEDLRLAKKRHERLFPSQYTDVLPYQIPVSSLKVGDPPSQETLGFDQRGTSKAKQYKIMKKAYTPFVNVQGI